MRIDILAKAASIKAAYKTLDLLDVTVEIEDFDSIISNNKGFAEEILEAIIRQKGTTFIKKFLEVENER